MFSRRKTWIHNNWVINAVLNIKFIFIFILFLNGENKLCIMWEALHDENFIGMSLEINTDETFSSSESQIYEF